jgi:hypothetical protein
MTRNQVFLATAVVVLSGLGSLWLWGRMPQIAAEDGLLEGAQALALGAGTVLSLLLMIKGGRRDSLVWFALLLFFLSILLRELDVEKYGLPTLPTILGSGIGRSVLLGAGWLALIGLFLRDVPGHRKDFLRFFSGWTRTVFLVGCLFYLGGLPFDKDWFGLSKPANLLGEEILEWAAAFFLLQVPLAGLRLLFSPARPSNRKGSQQ